jgi:hypothetical protein
MVQLRHTCLHFNLLNWQWFYELELLRLQYRLSEIRERSTRESTSSRQVGSVLVAGFIVPLVTSLNMLAFNLWS